MKQSLEYEREIIHDCITLLVMTDIQICRNRKVIDHSSGLSFMVLCRLLKTPHTNPNELFLTYQKIIKDNTIDGSTLNLSAKFEYRAVIEVVLLINPDWSFT